jgi:outer membrane lipopolysaccharide assembly protein LptE/RlpB
LLWHRRNTVKFKVQSSKFKVQSPEPRAQSPKPHFYPLSLIPYPIYPFIHLSIFSLTLFLSSCGYHFSGGGTLPQGVHKISLAEIDNETLEVGTEKQLQWALEQEFRKRGTAIVDDDSEGVLNVTMHQLDLRPMSFDRLDQVLEYQLILLLDVQLIHRETGKLLWQANNMRVQTNYDAVPQVVVTSSPRFLEGNLNAEDLRGLTDIQFSETQRRAAVERLFGETAREVYLRLSENF